MQWIKQLPALFTATQLCSTLRPVFQMERGSKLWYERPSESRGTVSCDPLALWRLIGRRKTIESSRKSIRRGNTQHDLKSLMSFLLDTNICSAYLKYPGALTHRFHQHGGRLYVTTLVLGELYTWAY